MHILHFKRLAAALVLGLFASGASAATVISATSVTSPQGDFGGSFALVNAINQSGLSAGYVSGVTDFASYTASTTHSSPGSGTNSGFTGIRGLPQIFSFDLGTQTSIDGLAIWANENIGSVTGFNLFADNDQIFGNGTGSLLGSFSVSGPSVLSTADVRSFAATTTQFLQLEVTAPTGFVTGIGEIAFRSATTTPVPVPASLPLLFAGLGAIGLIKRRKRKS